MLSTQNDSPWYPPVMDSNQIAVVEELETKDPAMERSYDDDRIRSVIHVAHWIVPIGTRDDDHSGIQSIATTFPQ